MIDGVGYRADIDGLRALAILPVVFYHAGIPGFAGGFVGVDVFFVISGYLMARLISGEIDRGEFSLLRFYERRVRRIFPALFAMVAASAVMAWLFFMPVELTYFARSVEATALFISNFRFEREMSYFDIGAQMKPLLHTWSLSVEEQFYIVFPLVLMLISRLGRRRAVSILALLLIVSLAASAWMVRHAPEVAFYQSQYRAWELLLGAVLAFNLVPAPAHEAVRRILTVAGIVLIAFAVFAYSEDTVFPGLAALVPCAGAALIIHGQATDGVASRFLRATPLVFIGLISYSLYLWHWPIIVFARYIGGAQLSLVQGVLIVAASFIVAVLSWRFIERPFRGHSSHVARKPLFGTAAAVVAASIAFGSYVAAERGLPGRLPPVAREIYNATYDTPRFTGENCTVGDDPSMSEIRSGDLCRLGTPGSEPSFLVWGDSHAEAMASAIEAAAEQTGGQGFLAGRSSCPPLIDVELSDRRDTERCEEFNAAVRDLIAARHISTVFLVAYWPKYVHDAELPNEGVYFDASVPPPVEDHSAPISEAMDRTLSDLTKLGAKVVLVMDVPEMGRYVPEALAKAVSRDTSTDIAPPWPYIAKRQALSRAMLKTFASKYDAVIVDPLPAFCSNGHCDAARDGIPLYRDADHITATTAKSLSYLYLPVFRSLSPDNVTAVR